MKNLFSWIVTLVIICAVSVPIVTTFLGCLEILWWIFTGDFFHVFDVAPASAW